MFVRFRQSPQRLQLSLVEARRVGGKVSQEHVAALGSILTPPSVSDRIKFWQRLHQRLDNLSNRIDAAAQAAILGAVHARVPMVTLDEQRAVKLENAKADMRFWASLQAMHAGAAEDHKRLIASAEARVAGSRSAALDAATKAQEASDRVERIERGEDVPGGLGEPVNVERVLRQAGMTTSDLNHARLLHAVSEVLGEDAVMEQVVGEFRESRRASAAVVRRMARRLERS
jgi:hypothetical protein